MTYLFRFLCGLSALAAVWAIVLWLTGGFHLELEGLRISSRRPRNAAVISLFFALLVWLLTFLPDGRNTFQTEWSRWRRWYLSTAQDRHVLHAFHIAGSALTIALVCIAIDIYQWRAALPLWVDEEMIALNLRDRSMSDLAGGLWLGQSAPFGWLILERAAMALFGTGEAAMRLVPLLFGIATVGAAAVVGQRWMGRIAAAVFVVMCWIGPQLSHYRFELKHYTADVLFGLLLPFVAVWAIEAGSMVDRARRGWLWWCAAAIGHWFANGALLVTPSCAIVLFVAMWRRDGRRAAIWFAIGGFIWLVSFAVHYQISIRHTLGNTYLREYWGAEILPPALGLAGSLRWLLERLEPLALNPGGTTLATALWTSAICGWALSMRRLGFPLAAVTVSAFAFASVVPLYGRFSIWMIPAMYAGVALLIDRCVAVSTDAFTRRRWALFAAAVLVLLVPFRLAWDIVARGKVDIEARHGATHKHQLDDRAAVRWLMSQRQPGDALITMHLALPAVWWYGKISIADEAGAGGSQEDGSPVLKVVYANDCPSRQLEDALKGHRRALVYLGFDVVPGFDRLLLDNLAQLGGLAAHREFSRLGWAAVIDLTMPASGSMPRLDRSAIAEPNAAVGCVGVQRAARW